MSRTSAIVFGALACGAFYACNPEFGALNAGAAGSGGVDGGTAGSGGRLEGGFAGKASGGTGGRMSNRGGEAGEPDIGEAGASGGETTGGKGGSGGRPPVIGGGAGSSGGGRGGTGGTGGTFVGRGGADPFGGAGEGGAPEWPGCTGAGLACSFRSAVAVTMPRPIQDDFTIEAWVKVAAFRPGQWAWQGNTVVSADQSSPVGGDFELVVLGGRLLMNIGTPDSGITGLAPIEAGKWTHVAATRRRTSGAVTLYVNGKLDVTSFANTMSLDAEPTLRFGVSPSGSYLDGELDEVKLWTTVRTQPEIEAGMFQPPDPNEPGLIGYYRFEELRGSWLEDSSSARNHGQTTNAAALVPSSAPLCGDGGSGGSGGSGGAP